MRFISVATVVLLLSVLASCELFNNLLGVDDYEPNDEIGNAYPIDLGESYSAYIGEDDADFFSFRPAHGADTYDAVQISVTAVGDDLRIGLALYDPQGERFDARTVNTKGADYTYTLRTSGLPAGDNFFIRFSGTWGVGGWAVGGTGDYYTQGPYTFTVRNLNANDAFAPNHTMDSAHPIISGQSYNGVLVSKYEADYFSFTPTSTSMTLTVSETDPELYLGAAWYGPTGTFLDKETFGTSGETGNITLTGLTAGETHYLRLSGTDGWSGWTVGEYADHESRGAYSFKVVD